jgi:hypothetical protein
MPTYQFYNSETKEQFEEFMSISMKEDLLSKNPHINQMPTGCAIVSGVGSIDSKTDNTWKEVLSKVAEKHPDSNVGKRYGKKSIAQVKTQQIIQKHRDKWKNK